MVENGLISVSNKEEVRRLNCKLGRTGRYNQQNTSIIIFQKFFLDTYIHCSRYMFVRCSTHYFATIYAYNTKCSSFSAFSGLTFCAQSPICSEEKEAQPCKDHLLPKLQKSRQQGQKYYSSQRRPSHP